MLPSTDVLIAGAGPAGLSTAINAASEGLHVTLIEPLTVGGQARWSSSIENVPGFHNGITGQSFTNRVYKQAKRFGATFITDRVENFCPLRDGTIAVQLSSARMIETRTVVLASGVSPKPLDMPGARSFGVFTGANPDDLPRWSGKRVAIVGGGNSAGQAAVALSHHGAFVTIYARKGLASSMSAYLVMRLAHLDIREHFPVTSIVPNGAQLTIASDTFDAIFGFVGSAPTASYPVSQDDLGFVSAPSFITSMSGVFAIGDVRADSTKRIAVAIGEGSAVLPLIHRHLKGSV